MQQSLPATLRPFLLLSKYIKTPGIKKTKQIELKFWLSWNQDKVLQIFPKIRATEPDGTVLIYRDCTLDLSPTKLLVLYPLSYFSAILEHK